MAATTIRFYSTGNPTGLKFAVEHGEARCIFDFGLEHAPGRAPFSMGLEPRPGRELSDLLAMGSAPALTGVYASGGWDGVTALFVSHMHLDHTALVRFVDPEVPLFFPEDMDPVRAAVDASGYLPWRHPVGSPLAGGRRVSWGDIEVSFVTVDHDLPGATGFVVRTPDLGLAYTGDYRCHGFHPELTAAFVEAARGVDVLVVEAVTAGLDVAATVPTERPDVLTEAEVVAEVAKAVGKAQGLAVINLYPMNRERVAAVGAEVERSTGRRLVMEPASAAIAGWRDLLEVEEVRAAPERFLVQVTFEGLPALIDLPRPPGSLFVHSNGAPLGPFDPAFGVMEAWAQALGLELVRIGTGGHAPPRDTERTVAAISPGIFLPVHSRQPEAVVVPGLRRTLVEPRRAYTLDALRAASETG